MMDQVHAELKDGSIREVAKGTTLAEFAATISRGLAKSAVVAKVDGKVTDLGAKLENNAKVEFLTFEDAEGRDAFRHTSSHILAQAVKRLFDSVKLAIGPASITETEIGLPKLTPRASVMISAFLLPS